MPRMVLVMPRSGTDSLVYGTLREGMGVAGCGDCAGEGGCRNSIVLVESSAKCGEGKQGWVEPIMSQAGIFYISKTGRSKSGELKRLDDDGLLSPGTLAYRPCSHAAKKRSPKHQEIHTRYRFSHISHITTDTKS
jgi:hypothetical protein